MNEPGLILAIGLALIHAFVARINISSGIPEHRWISFSQQIFDPFFTTKPIGKGTGIGLSISYQIIVEKHGGKLECVSSSDGTKFVIQLPIHQHAGVVG